MVSAEYSPGGLSKLSVLIGAPEAAIRLLFSILLGFPFALIHRYTIYGKNPSTQHVFFISCGLVLGYWNYEWDIVHSAAAVCGTYLILKILGSTGISVVATFIFNMTYLLYGYYTTSTDGYDIKWTMPQCVLTLRIIGLAFDLWDSQKPKEKLSESQKQKILTEQPSLLEMLSYSYFPGSFLVGPQFSMRRYLDYVNGRFIEHDANVKPGELPKCWSAGIQRALIGFVYVALYQIISLYVSDDYLLSTKFQKINFFKRCFFVGLWAYTNLYKYISCWLITEGVCIAFGLTYNGKNSSGQPKWDGCANVNLLTFECASCLNHYILSFNINTNQWCAEYIYKRLKFLGSRFLSQLFTLFFLAVWHGFHSGYYHCFFMEFVMMYFEKDIGPVLSKNEKVQHLFNKNFFTRFIGTILLKIYTIFGMSYNLVSFNLLSYSRYIQVYASLYYFAHIIFISYPLYARFIKSALRQTSQRSHQE